MRLYRLGLVCCTATVLTLLALWPPGATTLAQPGSPTPRPGRESACGGSITGTLANNTVRMCDETELELEFEPFCPVCAGGMNVVFVMMKNAPEADWQNQSAILALQELKKLVGIDIWAGVTTYARNDGFIAQEMTPDLDLVEQALRRPNVGEQEPFGAPAAARLAARMIQEARRDHGVKGEKPCEFVVFFGYAKPHVPGAPSNALREAVVTLRGLQVKLMVGCPIIRPDHCNVPRELPNPQRYYTEPPNANELVKFFRQELKELLQDGPQLKSMSLTQFLPPGIEYIEGSAKPPPASVSLPLNGAGGDATIRWTWPRQDIELLEPYSVTYRVRPAQVGRWTITGEYEVTDLRGALMGIPAPAFPITVTDELCSPLSTPTAQPPPPTFSPPPPTLPPPPPTPTETPVPPTATPMPTDTPTPTPTPKPRPIYLPIVIGESCITQWVYSDVVLVLDVSTSMNRLTRTGRSKLAATQDAAKTFLGRMDFSPNGAGQHDQVAIVGFNRSAWIQQSLTSDKAAIMQGIDDLSNKQAEFTRLDLAIQRGVEALQQDLRKTGNTPVVILLTDGLPNQVPYAEDGTMETTVLREAAKAKAANVDLYTIAIGPPEDTNPQLLTACASAIENFFYTPDPEDLAHIYTKIAYSFGCPAEGFWGKR